MNETNFDPTFAEKVQIDNALDLDEELDYAQTTEKLDEVSKRPTAFNPNTGVSEVGERTGEYQKAEQAPEEAIEKKREEFDLWEDKKEQELIYIRNADSIFRLINDLGFIREASKQGLLGPEQLAQLEAAAEAKKAELWEGEKKKLLSYIDGSITIPRLNMALELARYTAEEGLLGDAQLQEILAVGEAKREALQVAAAISG